MVLTTLQKTCLSTNLTSITNRFNAYSATKNYMGVFFTQNNKPYLTFNTTNSFPNFIVMAGNKYTLACVYNLKTTMSTQTSGFLA